MKNFCLPEGVQVIGGKFASAADGVGGKLRGLRHGEKRLRAQAIRMQILKMGRCRTNQHVPFRAQFVAVKNGLQGKGRFLPLNADDKGVVCRIAVEHILRQAEIDQLPGQEQFLPACPLLFRRAGGFRPFFAGCEMLLQEEQALNDRTLARAVYARQQRQRAKGDALPLEALEIRQLHTVKHAAPPGSAREFFENGI